ncbi:MAG TPA: slipin family protein [Candidatus Omnitrophota bacterium]|nr:slipin family protein [Candidatus Omnitrophota bacterium]
MQVFPVIVSIIIVWIGILYLISQHSIIVYEFERGLKYRKGRFVGVLNAGRYWIFFPGTTVKKIDVRPKFISVPGQEVLSVDSVTLKVSVAARYEIADPNLAVNKIENYTEAFYAVVQLAIREIIGSMKIDEILEQRPVLNQKLMDLTAGKVEEMGIRLQLIGIKDIMFPGELKKVFAKVIEAQKEGLAALERARGETAVLRNLANVAKVLEDNPALMPLRALQSTGNTVVIGVGGAVIPAKEKKQG